MSINTGLNNVYSIELQMSGCWGGGGRGDILITAQQCPGMFYAFFDQYVFRIYGVTLFCHDYYSTNNVVSNEFSQHLQKNYTDYEYISYLFILSSISVFAICHTKM